MSAWPSLAESWIWVVDTPRIGAGIHDSMNPAPTVLHDSTDAGATAVHDSAGAATVRSTAGRLNPPATSARPSLAESWIWVVDTPGTEARIHDSMNPGPT
jgi:hypothetical protein